MVDAKIIDYNRWLLNIGVVSVYAQNNLFFYASIVHKDVKNIEVDVDIKEKKILYKLYFDTNMIKKINLYNKLYKNRDIISLYRLKYMIKKVGILDFNSILNKNVKDFCGPQWSANVEVFSEDQYKGTIDVSNDVGNREN